MNEENTFEVFSFFHLSAIALKNSRQYLDYVAYIYIHLYRILSVKRRYTIERYEWRNFPLTNDVS